MNRSGAVWTMAKRNLRRSWARNLLLVIILTLAIAGDVLVGLFFTGLEARAESLAQETPQSVSMMILAPDWVNTPALVNWARRAGVFYGGVNYDAAYMIAWRECLTPGGRTMALYLDFESPYLKSLGVQGRWPYEAGEVALPVDMATSWGVTVGSQIRLAIGTDPRNAAPLKVTGVFRPETTVSRQDGRVTRRETVQDPSLNFPVLALYPGGAAEPVLPINAAFLDLSSSGADSLESKIRTYVEREYPRQPALSRLTGTGLVILRPETGPNQAESIGRVIFAPGRKALAGGFLFVGVGIFVILLIAFIERKREFAVLKTVGMNNSMVMTMILMELGAVAAIALAAGSGLAVGIGQMIARVVEYVPAPTVGAWLWSIVHAGVVLVLATLLPLSMARLATVQQLLQNERLYIFRKRVTLS